MKYLTLIVALLISGIGESVSQRKSNSSNPDNIVNPREIMVSWARRIKQGFNLRVWLSNQMTLGLQAWDGDASRTPDGNGLEYPVGTNVEHLYGAGPRIGAIVDGRVLVDEGYNGWDARKELLPEYSHRVREHFWRTAVGSNEYDNIGYSGYYYNHGMIVNRKGIDDDLDGKIDEDELDDMDNDGDWDPPIDDVGMDGLPDSIEISCDGQPYDPITNPDPAQDNYEPDSRDICHPNPDWSLPFKNDIDIYTEKNGLPDHGEPNIDEDYGAISHNDLYCSAIDTFKKPIIPGHVPMGAKVFFKSYAWEKGTSADAIVFLDYSFINMGRNPWQDVYLGIFADPDLGPTNVSGYYQHNYTAYDSITRTAYVDNPADEGSTPIGFTLLGTSKSLDSLKFIYRWSDFTTQGYIDPGTIDTNLYLWLNGDAFPDQPICPSQTPDILQDTRFYFSFGKFQVQPSDTVKAVFALVSGMNLEDMFNNVKRAQQIYESGGFIMPMVHIADSGNGKSIKIFWDDIERSPFGDVTSYRVYYGTSSGEYTDSISTSELSVIIPGLSGSQNYYFSVVAFDDKGNRSPFSGEVTNTPQIPIGFQVLPHQKSILLLWSANPDPDALGYNVYRKSSFETTYVKLNFDLITDTSFVDAAVWGDKTYHYKISAVDRDGHESRFSVVKKCSLIPPAKPANFAIGAGKDFICLSWSPNQDEDIAGYNIYRSNYCCTNFMKMNDYIWKNNYYFDLSVLAGSSYYYYIEAVDTTDAVSSQSTSILEGYTVINDGGVLIIHKTLSGIDQYLLMKSFYDSLMSGYKYEVDSWGLYNYPRRSLEYAKYSTILFLFEKYPNCPQDGFTPYPIAFRNYLLSGGQLLIMGRRLSAHCFPYWSQFLSEIFGINPLLDIDSSSNFFGAVGNYNYPSVLVDTAKLSQNNGRLNFIERFKGIPTERILYTYLSNPFDPSMEGDPVGISPTDTSFKVYYFSFPLYYLEYPSAQALITKILEDFGEVMGVRTIDQTIPTEYRLHDAYPNPFNSMTTIRFDLPKDDDVTLQVFNLLGQEVATLVCERKQAGRYAIDWNANDAAGGVYFYRLSTGYLTGKGGGFTDVKKLVLMK